MPRKETIMAKEKKKWFARGKEGVEMSKRNDEEMAARREARGPRRFWLENESSAKVTLLDNPEFFVYEHNLKLGGKYHNYFTCLQQIDTCPICESGDSPSFILVATVINHKKFEGKDGKVFKNQKQLIVFKSKAKEKILRQLEKKGNLRFTVWELSRGSSSTECSTGEDFEYLGKWGQDKEFQADKLKAMVPDKEDPKTWLRPFDYETIFAPKEPDELRKIVGGAPPVGGKDDSDDLGGGGGSDDDDPFFNDDDKSSKGKEEKDNDPLEDDEKPKKDKGGKASGKKASKPSDDDTSIEDLL